ncbi:MAG: peptide chain release factor N(5)-glutamine methyltransferase [Planctomycetota bacterium]
MSLAETWVVRDVLAASTKYLAGRGVETARLDSELMLADVLRVDRMELYVEPERAVTDDERAGLRELVRRRGEREPVQHILGKAGFYSLEIKTDARALVPRRETELLVDRALKLAGSGPVRALDLGTGSGCIACALAKNLPPGSHVCAADVSAAALALARENAGALGLAEGITFLEGDLFEALGDDSCDAPFDVVVANLPYVPSGEFDDLLPEVRDHEPRAALDGGRDGLDVIRRAVESAPPFIVPGGWMLLEVGDGQAEIVTGFLEAAGLGTERPLRDPGGIDRVAQGRRPEQDA